MLLETNVDTILKNYCKKTAEGCNWGARRNKMLHHIKIVHTKSGKPDKVEFLERDKARKSNDKNIEYLKLKKPIIVLDDPNETGKFLWYEFYN
tara:strand:- start:433 stop:711 length:279 start_codon:yes stop_codon:yes gene_type:complete